jgi:hypothetical protein
VVEVAVPLARAVADADANERSIAAEDPEFLATAGACKRPLPAP